MLRIYVTCTTILLSTLCCLAFTTRRVSNKSVSLHRFRYIPDRITVESMPNYRTSSSSLHLSVSVFESPEVINSGIKIFVVSTVWLIPYAIFNLIVAPKLGLSNEEDATPSTFLNIDDDNMYE